MPLHRLIVITTLLFFASSSIPLFAEDTSATDTTDESIASELDSSEVERLIKLEATLKSDKKILKEFNKSLVGRSTISKKLQTGLHKLTIELEQQKAKLTKAKEKNNSKLTARLEKEIKELRGDYDLVKEQAQLTFAAEKTVKSQIELLEKSIIRQKLVLDELKGIKKSTPIIQQQPSISTSPIPAQPAQSIPISPMQIIAPTFPVPTTTTDTVKQPGTQMLTAEQVEAEKQAQLRIQEATRAKQVARDYIEQRSVLLEQIKLDNLLLKTDGDSLENYEKLIKVLKKELKGSISQKRRNSIKANINLVNSEVKKLKRQIKNRTKHVVKAKKNLVQLEEDQELLSEVAEEKSEEAEAAQKHVLWLQSPLHPRNLMSWAFSRGPRVLLVLIFMTLLLYINKYTAVKVSHVLARKSIRKGKAGHNRADTLALSFRGAARVVILFGGMLMALQEAGVDIQTILGGAAILGVAIAFGAQNLMRDYFNGFMILLEDQYELNDVVTINKITGTVERVSMRTTMIRDLSGRAHFIPNGVITHVTNNTFEWARAVFEIPVAYKENVDHVMSVIMDLANELRQDSEFGPFILAEPNMLGVNSFDDFGVTIKFMLQTRSDKMWPVRREVLRRVKNKFDELGIQIPVPQRLAPQTML